MNLHRLPPEEYKRLVEDIKQMKDEVESQIVNLSPIPTYEQVGKIFMSRRMDVLLLALDALENIVPATEWTADVGAWGKEINVNLDGVTSIREAIKRAEEMIEDMGLDGYWERFGVVEPRVLSIYCNGYLKV